MATIGTKGFHVGEYISDEMAARGWSRDQMAIEMDCGNAILARCIIDFLIDCPCVEMYLDRDVAEMIAKAFGTSAETWMKLDQSWHEANGAASRPGGGT